MKKVILVFLALAMAFTFVACGTANNDVKPTDEPKTEEPQKLVMATNASFPPYEFVGENGAYEGIDVEIAGKIAEKLGLELEIVDTEFGSIIGGVQSGKYDFGMAGMTVTEERKKSVDFSDSYATAVQVVIVAADSPYESFEEFYTGFDADENPTGVVEGIKIGVQQDTTGDIYSSDTPDNWGFGQENVIRYKTGNDAVEALKAGKVTAVIIDNEPAKSFVAANEGLNILEGAYAEEEYAICVAKENSDLLDQINTALQELTDDGVIADIVEKYIPSK